ncbi:bifunctional metallophosphatase/5'-nucleotidase [bacterium]|nr:bifunctional metallophosphatase/5'-nucleotidase [bacterium]
MQQNRKIFRFLLFLPLLVPAVLLFSIFFGTNDSRRSNKIVILYTNDIHTFINNRDAYDEKSAESLSYSALAAIKKDLEEQGAEVILVDAGDHLQGTAFGSVDKGETIIRLMNAAGYSLAVPGNHEFDYGIQRFFELAELAEFTYISANFYKTDTGKLLLPTYKIIEKGGKRIAFIGISTPESITKSTPVYFMDNNGNLLYNFYNSETKTTLCGSLQNTIDSIRGDADYIVALGHLGIDISSSPYTSREIIACTKGLDAFIDGHSHTLLEHEYVRDAAGNDVLLTQTGEYFKAAGKMTISENGTLTTEIITGFPITDPKVEKIEQEWITSLKQKFDEKIAVLDTEMFVTDPKNPEQRMIRNQETNLGDLLADSYYHYFNEILQLDCDTAFSNGGGTRNGIKKGFVSYLSAKTVLPFSDTLCIVEATGQQIKDALENGAIFAGLWDHSKNIPAESGGFQQVAGMTFEINTSVKSSVQVDENKIWLGPPTGRYKVENIRIYNRKSRQYEPVDLEKIYRVAANDYTLKNSGDGMAMFKKSKIIRDSVGKDHEILVNYLKAFKKGGDGFPHISTENSPLKSYENYLLNYENPYGSGRIKIKK